MRGPAERPAGCGRERGEDLKRLALLLALATIGAVAAAGSKAAVGAPQVSFHGSMCCSFSIDGTFTLDHFEVKTPLNLPFLSSPPVPRLIAVGTATVTRTDDLPGSEPTTWTNAPLDWVNVSVAASCGGDVTVNLDELNGGDYFAYIVSSDSLWDSSVPLVAWDPGDVHWSASAANAVTLHGTHGTSCSVSRLARNPKTLKPLAAALNRALGRS
jgi:hypothetical protein